MTANASPPEMSAQPQADDAYWTALFEQEEALLPVEPKVDIPKGHDWKPVPQRLDGRFRWADGERNNEVDPWHSAQTIMDADETMTLPISGYNKGGLLVHWRGLQGFVPASQLIDFPQFHLESERLNALREWHTETLTLKIIELNREMNRLIFSERATLVEADERDELFDRIQKDQIHQGTVTNLTNFGAFIDLGGVEGLIHISELSWSRVIHPSDILEPGQTVTVKVLNVDSENGRVALSLKRLKDNPWITVDARYQPGQLVEGTISNVVSFGAFVMIEDELEGLIHISQLAEGTFLHPRNVVEKGQIVVARVLKVDGRNKRLALTLRDLTAEDIE
ncbi:MAG: S1 RNA-binding domain-containing protein [Ardenticatenaceae bacterium]|nr:S1 RNA-binding domain-containing protein [Anaerolineales bacterium]MCB8939686.1 S1 RNA-binding domain-containing protein [Ardenticatenaceae bacterium]MCB8974889.1 S1 RNA-binding domain-containing protein [Ardenticatenaceae bacterium]